MSRLILSSLALGIVFTFCAPISSSIIDILRLIEEKEKSEELQRNAACMENTDPLLFVLDDATPHILAVSEKPFSIAGTELRVDGVPIKTTKQQLLQGPPYAIEIKTALPLPEKKEWLLELLDGKKRPIACTRASRPPKNRAASPTTGVWSIRRSWNESWERLFSVWVATLFNRYREGVKGWKPLHQVLHNKEFNLFYNYLGLGEDNPENESHVQAIADCGDVPYQLRAYFSWKLGLPFRFSHCTRGSARLGPKCREESDNQSTAFDQIENPVERFNAFIHKSIAWRVHSGTMRTLPEDEDSDFYPIALKREAIRPGTVFVDVGGHVLVVTRWDKTGLFAIDGHPDKTVTRKRFQERYFPYAKGIKTGGFKAFRPVELKNGEITPLANNARVPFFSTEQYDFKSRKSFYRRIEGLTDNMAQ